VSIPTPDLSTDSMRFLSTEQALADSDYFARNVDIPGLGYDVKAPGTPWIYYGTRTRVRSIQTRSDED
jgi:hypothetical protein